MPWYVVQTVPGMERRVNDLIRAQQGINPVFDIVQSVKIPQARRVDVRLGHREEVEEKTFPGYVMIEMPPIVEEDTDARNAMMQIEQINGVLLFLRSEAFPLPLGEADAMKALRWHKETKAKHRIGDDVAVTEGVFSGYRGRVVEVGNTTLTVEFETGVRMMMSIDGVEGVA